MTQLAHIADRVLNRPLLLLPDKLSVIASVLSGRIGITDPQASRFEGDQPQQVDSEGKPKLDRWGYPKGEPFMLSGSTAIVTVTGSLVNRGAWIGASSGLTSYEGIQHQLKRADGNGNVESIILDLHTPGGEAIGAFETGALVRDIASRKRVVAVVNGMAASAGYAIAAGASEIVTTETGLSGSIGVVMMHVDYSKMLASEGIQPTFVFAGAHKVDGHPFAPLSDSVRSDLQAEIDAFYEQFLTHVARGRGERLTVDQARATEARTFIGQAAVDVGLADRVGTFESVLADLTRGARRTTTSRKGHSMTEANGGPAAETNAGITQAQLDQAVAKASNDASASFAAQLKADRERMAGLDELAAKVAGNAPALQIISDAKASGASVEATGLALIKADAFAKAAVLGAIQSDDPTATAATPAAPGGAAKVPQTAAGWTAEWEASAELQSAYPKVEHYVAFRKADAGGKVRILEGRASK